MIELTEEQIKELRNTYFSEGSTHANDNFGLGFEEGMEKTLKILGIDEKKVL